MLDSTTGEVPPIVLLIERDRETLECYAKYFEDAGLWVAAARLADEAVAAAEDLTPDIVVADADAGESAMEDVVEALKQHPAFGNLPVIVMTSTPQTESHADSLLIKPVPPALLLLRTKELLTRAREVRARSDSVVRKGRRLLERSATLLERTRAIESPAATQRTCPDCGTPLEWIEEGSIGLRTYDYYRWCLKDCGLYCFDRHRAAWIKLA